jgi:hypothetical protein
MNTGEFDQTYFLEQSGLRLKIVCSTRFIQQ